jgi:hypothetical protein
MLADVGAGDANPLVSGGVGEHAAQQLAVALPELGLLGERPPRLADPLGQRVAHPLQLLEAGDPRRTPRRADAGLDLAQREGLGGKPGQLELQTPDLAPQLGPREALVASDAKRAQRVSFKQIRHREPASSVDHRRSPKTGPTLRNEC